MPRSTPVNTTVPDDRKLITAENLISQITYDRLITRTKELGYSSLNDLLRDKLLNNNAAPRS